MNPTDWIGPVFGALALALSSVFGWVVKNKVAVDKQAAAQKLVDTIVTFSIGAGEEAARKALTPGPGLVTRLSPAAKLGVATQHVQSEIARLKLPTLTVPQIQDQIHAQLGLQRIGVPVLKLTAAK